FASLVLAGGLGARDSFAGALVQKAGLEFSEHRQHLEHSLTERVCGIVGGPAVFEAHAARVQAVSDRGQVGRRPAEAVELRYDEGVPGPESCHGLVQPGALAIGTGESTVGVDVAALDASLG